MSESITENLKVCMMDDLNNGSFKFDLENDLKTILQNELKLNFDVWINGGYVELKSLECNYLCSTQINKILNITGLNFEGVKIKDNNLVIILHLPYN